MKIKYATNVAGRRVILKCKKCNTTFEGLLLKVKIGKDKYCSNECYIEDRKVTEEHKREQHKLHQKKFKYGLTADEYNELIKIQNNSCLICKVVFLNTTRYNAPCVDHCHKTKNNTRFIMSEM